MARTGAQDLRRTLRAVIAIGRVTFLEVLRDKILYSTLGLAVLLLSVGFLASHLTFVRPERIVLDFGLSALQLTGAALGILLGAEALIREIERRTMTVALTRPVSRTGFVVGKFAGLALILSLNGILLDLVFILILGTDSLSVTLCWALFFTLIQSWMLASLAMALSAFSTTALSVMMTVGIFLAGSSVSQIRLVAARVKSTVGSGALETIAAVLPNFEFFHLGTQATYGLPLALGTMVGAIAYGAVWIAFALGLAGFLIQSREL